MTSYQPYGGQGNTGFGVKPVKPVVANKAIGAGIGKVVQPTLSDFLGFAPEEMNQLRQASNLPTQEEVDMQLSTQLFTPTDITAPLDTNVPAVAGISDFLSGIASRQAQTAANVAAIQGRDSDDLGTAPTKPKPTMEEFDDDLGNALNTLGQDLSQSSSTPIKDDVRDGDDLGTAVTATESSTVAGALDDTTDKPSNPFAEILKTAMDNVSSIKGEEPKGTIDDYKEEFAKATGIDISGKVDKSQALMALGLSLMQNKAGKGFNVSNALAALGEAGEAAAPAFQKAKSEAKAAKLASGKYALGELSKDEQAKAGRLAAAQSTVSDLLGKQQDFFSKLQLQRDQQIADSALKKMEHRNALKEEAAKGVDLYTDKLQKTPLFQDAPDVFEMVSFVPNPNLPGGVRPGVRITDESVAGLRSNLPAMEQAINKSAGELANLKKIVQEEGITVQQQLGSALNSFVRGFGINVEGNLDPVAEAKIILKRIATQNTSEILGEAGKTISDVDRKLVNNIVGEINMLDGADAQVILTKLNSVYELVVQKGRKNLDTAYGTLTASGYGNADYGLVPEGYRRAQQNVEEAADPMDETKKARLAALREKQGAK
tara:strand:+ start:73 stop:1875 length:1803 start_codon:yes stop_codon:yes gene_type:complete